MNHSRKLPAVFVGHGSPMNAIEDTQYSRAWKALGEALPRPRAIVVVSAHWYVHRTAVTATEHPPTIHDFTGFPKQLYEMRYAAPGDPELAREIAALLAPSPVTLDTSWGYDHGSWSVLMHMYPKADIPVVELSVDATKSPAQHLDTGRKLAPLRERNVLVMATGNVVHNLAKVDPAASAVPDWAQRFDDYVWKALEKKDDGALVEYERQPDAAVAAPDPDHFRPLLYIAGIRQPDDGLRSVIAGFDLGSVSMRAFQVGG